MKGYVFIEEGLGMGWMDIKGFSKGGGILAKIKE